MYFTKSFKNTVSTDIIYESKIGLEILIPTILILGTVTAIVIIESVWIGVITCGLVWLLLINIYTKTYYKITGDNRLIIKCWIIESWEIEIKDIISISLSNSVLSSSALSLDRLEINYKGGRVLISPKDKKKFMNNLRKVNPNINYRYVYHA